MNKIIKRNSYLFASVLLVLTLLLAVFMLGTARGATSPISGTPHNLSRSGVANNLSNVRADPTTGETEICVFCHTPHGANTTTVKGPLWNRSTSGATYTRYTSGSLDATNNGTDGYLDQPAGSSLLCLSCHDGMVAIGQVNNLRGAPATIALNNTNAGKMPVGLFGATETSGFTRVIGTDLSNDHPISITFNDALASTDGELQRLTTAAPAQRDKITGNIIGVRQSGYKPSLPLEPTGTAGVGQVQCGTCHDPHSSAEKFLRLSRYQLAAPAGGDFLPATDQICLACHPRAGTAWSESAHANPTTADETYTAAAAALRQFKISGSPPQVWQVGCLNCHDTHTAQGSRRLLREGVGGTAVVATGTAAGATFQPGYASQADNSVTSAVENTCFQCHRAAGGVNALTAASGSTVPAIMDLFNLTYGMPIKTADQATSSKEVHNIKDSNLLEDPVNLGLGNNANRHAECSDCHNPHRVRRNKLFSGTSSNVGGSDGAKRTHDAGGPSGNIASGVLRGTWGVEPAIAVISGSQFPQNPTFTIKKGDPGAAVPPTSKAETIAATYVTREHQLCFKCHSNYSNGPLPSDFAAIGYAGLGTQHRGTLTASANGLTRYTNVAAEFSSVTATDPPTTGTDQGEFANGTANKGTACGSADCAPRTAEIRVGTGLTTGTAYNHRSWHPVMFPTGRDRAERAMTAGTGAINLLPPYKATIGLNTMHCSDCHGQATSWIPGNDTGSVGGPDPAQVQGPHGSENPFLLRGIWTTSVNLSNIRSTSTQFVTNRPLCGNCHQPRDGSSGFNSQHVPSSSSNMSGLPCMRCHIAVPHGWRNKAFLANMRCVGTEVRRVNANWSAGTKTTPTDCDDFGDYNNGRLDEEPYYYQTILRVPTWARSGTWGQNNCGGSSMTSKSGC